MTCYKINVFKELIEKYVTWDDLRIYLESEEGGLFKVVDQNDMFYMIRYEKGVSKMDLPHSKWFRSVVWNSKTHRPVCVAPPKASTDFSFESGLISGLICQELLDGFMINCFKDKTLHITSRSKLDAAGNFYSKRSFRDLFTEAYGETFNKDCYTNYSTDPSNTFYSFLVQHTEHRVVKKIETNRVFVVHKGVVLENGIVEIEDMSNIETIPHGDMHWVKNIMIQNDWQFQGIVFKDNIGNRWKFRSDKYNAVKALRGNSSNVCDRFTQLITQNLLYKYLEYYQEDMIPMTMHVMFLNNIIKILYDYYVNMHIKKIKMDINRMYLPHLYNIHGLYLTQLRPNRVTMNDISLYLHRQPWQRISFLITSFKNTFKEIT